MSKNNGQLLNQPAMHSKKRQKHLRPDWLYANLGAWVPVKVKCIAAGDQVLTTDMHNLPIRIGVV